MRLFSQQSDLIQFAREFVLERIRCLENDAKLCLSSGGQLLEPAPFPALLYCFSVIDLLGALLAGNAKPGQTAEQAKEYMQRFMNYTQDQAELLQRVFRHKLVHLAQPAPITKNKSRIISWEATHDYRARHLVLEPLRQKGRLEDDSIPSVEYDHVFHVGIWNLVEDIKFSVENPNGYLCSLERSVDLKDKFEKVIFELFYH